MKKTVTLFLAFLLVGVLSSFTITNDPYPVDKEASTVKWTGYHLAKSYEHTGYVTLKSGNLNFANGLISSGEFVIDMNTITDVDLKDAKDNAKLVKHLKSEDFFDVKNHPEAKLVIKKSVAKSPGILKTTADLTIRGITKTIEFETRVKEVGDKIEAIAELNIPRTDFKVMYGWSIENAMLAGEFKLEIKVIANK